MFIVEREGDFFILFNGDFRGIVPFKEWIAQVVDASPVCGIEA